MKREISIGGKWYSEGDSVRLYTQHNFLFLNWKTSKLWLVCDVWIGNLAKVKSGIYVKTVIGSVRPSKKTDTIDRDILLQFLIYLNDKNLIPADK